MIASEPSRPFRIFLIVWFGQLISLTGSGLTSFALGLWLLQRSGSVTEFALISFCATLPGIVVAPLAGALVDRRDRRQIMILSDTVAGLCSLGMALALLQGSLTIWHIYLATIISSVFSSLRWPALMAAMSTMVPKEQLGRTSGLVQLGQAIARICAPPLAALLIGIIGVGGVLLIDVATFVFALTTLLAVRFPMLAAATPDEQPREDLATAIRFGWVYIRERPGLLTLMIFIAISNLMLGLISVLVTPLVLSFSSATALGTVLAVGGSGMLVGSVAMSAWGGPRRRMQGVLVGIVVAGMAIAIGSVWMSVAVLAAAAFTFFFVLPIINGCARAIMQSKVDLAVQGRVFAIAGMIATSTLPLAALVAGPLTDRIFEPLLLPGGPLTGSVGAIIGIGAGRGTALLFSL